MTEETTVELEAYHYQIKKKKKQDHKEFRYAKQS